MIFFGCTDNEINHIGKTSAAPAALLHGMIDLRRNDELPTVLIEEAVDHVPDFPIGYVIATANEHAISAIKHDIRYPLFIKRMLNVKKK